MICPNCKTDLKYKERSGKKCSSCKTEFAFEPKTDKLGLHDARFRKAVEKISKDGSYYYTASQLLYFLSRKKVRKNSSFSGAIVLSFIILFVVFFVSFNLLLVGAAAIILCLICLALYRANYKRLPLAPEQFEVDVLPRWEQIHKTKPDKLIANENFSKAVRRPRTIENARGVLICEETDVHLCLLANRVDEKLGLILINPAEPLAAWEAEKFNFVRGHKNLPVFVLHDASPMGCLLTEKIAGVFFANEQQSPRVFDIGLSPAKMINSSFLQLSQKPPGELIKLLNGKLSAEEIDWLKKGNYVSLLSLPPAQLIAYITASVNKKINTIRHESEKYVAEKKAQAVGFMTWVE